MKREIGSALVAVVLAISGCASRPAPATADEEEPPTFNTFSIVAADPQTGEVGVAVATKLPAVGMYVPFADPAGGAVASQAIVNPVYGPRALELLKQGVAPQKVIEQLTAEDKNAPDRQISVISAKGEVASFTGSRNSKFAGHRTGSHYTVAGNLLSSEDVINKMAAAFENTPGRLSDRMLAALTAGDQAGGDSRGKQSAAILVVRPNAYFNGKVLDLRLDDHPKPIEELTRVHAVYMTQFLNLPGYAPLKEGDAGPHIRKLNTQLATLYPDHAVDLTAKRDTYTAATQVALAQYLGLLPDTSAPLPLTPAKAYELQQTATTRPATRSLKQ